MRKKSDFIKLSYQKHDRQYDNYLDGGNDEEKGKTWLRSDTVDYWRHERMYKQIDVIMHSYPESTWLTVGDGRYGSEARYINDMGFDVTASDISDRLLKIAQNKGLIKKYKKENAESLSYKDGAFDFVLCKEAFHHFPRPYLALYEMLRVCREGIVLIEPLDAMVSPPFLYMVLKRIKKVINSIIGKKTPDHYFEEIGNYIYGISEREIEKAALGIGLNTVAFKGINDHYIDGVEYEKISKKSKLFNRIKKRIFILDFLTAISIKPYALLVAIIFKSDPSSDIKKSMQESGYNIKILPSNPYM